MFNIFIISLNKINLFVNLRNWIIVATFFCLWISTMFNDVVQTFLAYGLILTFGVLHGSNDLNIIKHSTNKYGIDIQFSKVLGYYVLTVLTILVVFFIFPPLALLLFILLSGYHFGEQHFKKHVTRETFSITLLYLFYGLTILFMIFYFNINKVKLIFLDLTKIEFGNLFFKYTLISVLVLFFTFLIYLTAKKKVKLNLIEELFYILALLVVFATADLLWGFCIYFILWHSLPSLTDQIEVLYGRASKIEFIKYIRASWLYWLVSITGLGVLYIVFRDNSTYLTSILIYFLAAITFPHVIVMSTLEKH